MMRLKLSWLLIPILLSLAINIPSLRANENQSQKLEESDSAPLSSKQQTSELPSTRIEKNNKAKEESDNTKKVPNTPSVSPIAIGQPAAQAEKEYPANKPEQSFVNGFSPQTWASWAQVLVAAGGLYFIWLTLQAMQDQVRVAQATASAALEEVKTVMLSERAYVQLSHMPPGVRFEDFGRVWVHMRVKNFGNTPARITQALAHLNYITDGFLPTTLTLSGPTAITSSVLAFQLPGDELFFQEERSLGVEIVDRLMDGQGLLVVWGHVDYIDQFGKRHRAGYGRVFNHQRDSRAMYLTDEAFNNRSNLDFVENRTYNYDRQRNPGEGNDWDQA